MSGSRETMAIFQVAIDGPAASGKSTIARRVAERLGGYYVNTGDMYRTVTWVALQRGVDVERQPQAVVGLLAGIDLGWELDGKGGLVLCLDGAPVPQDEIRSPTVAKMVSVVARIREVRAWIRPRQRATQRVGIVVMEGRDIGSVVLPEAAYKFFITASAEVRARRRLAQTGEVAAGATVSSVAAEIAQRDHLDSTREVAPLKAVADAVVICSDGLTIEQTVERVLAHIPQEIVRRG